MSVHYLFQYVKDRVSRMQSENSFSNFAEAKLIFEATPQRPPKVFEATPQRTLVEPFRRCKGRDKKKVYETSSYTSTGISNTLTVFLTLFRSYVFLGDGNQQHFHLFHQCVA